LIANNLVDTGNALARRGGNLIGLLQPRAHFRAGVERLVAGDRGNRLDDDACLGCRPPSRNLTPA
jgi:hypothetical protein